jgi:hypothetical protein
MTLPSTLSHDTTIAFPKSHTAVLLSLTSINRDFPKMAQRDTAHLRKTAITFAIEPTSNSHIHHDPGLGLCVGGSNFRGNDPSSSTQPVSHAQRKTRMKKTHALMTGKGDTLLFSISFVLFAVYLMLCFATSRSFPKVEKQLVGLTRPLVKKSLQHSVHKTNEQVLPLQRVTGNAGKSNLGNACSDFALYFNINKKKWGVFTKLNITIEDAFALKGPVWLIVELVMSASYRPIPECEDFEAYFRLNPADLLKQNKLKERHHLNFSKKTFKLLFIDGSDEGLLFNEYGHPLNECVKNASDRLGPSNVYVASRALVVGRNLSQNISYDTMFSELNGTVFDYRTPNQGDETKALYEYIHNGVVALWDFAIRPEYISVFDEIVRTKVGGVKNSPLTADDYFEFQRSGDVAHFWDVEPNDLYGQFRFVCFFIRLHQPGLY